MNNCNSDLLIQLFTEGLQAVLPSNFISDLTKIDDDYLWVNGHKHKLSKNLKIMSFGKASGTMLDAFLDVIILTTSPFINVLCRGLSFPLISQPIAASPILVWTA